MASNIITSQTGGRQFNNPNITKYSLFVGGVNATSHALRNYSPLLNGFGRLFMVRAPYAIAKIYAGAEDARLYSNESRFIQFRHMLEYMNRSVTGFGMKQLDPAATDIQGGFAGRKFKTPTVTKEMTESVTIGLYEMIGCPIFDVIDTWINAIGDENSGYATYGGWIAGGYDKDGKAKRLYKRSGETDDGIDFNEANHTAEFIYVLTDRSGGQVERAVMLADCYPTGIDQGQVLNMQAGGVHDNVTYDITFNCVLYRSPIITSIANDLLKQYRIVSNSLNFNPELGDAVYDGDTTKFNKQLAEVPTDSATGTDIGNVPVYNVISTAKTVDVSDPNIEKAKMAGSTGNEASKADTRRDFA